MKAMIDDPDLEHAAVRRTLLDELRQVRADLVLVSPYFVPGSDTTTLLTETVFAGTRVRLLTNSLAATDMSAVHGAYARHRRALLAGGVEIWELKPGARIASRSVSRTASLHTKALLFDRRRLFVGSYNLDPRSAWINCEQGVLIENDMLAKQLEGIFERQTADSRAWKVALADGDLRWVDGTETFTSDPRSPVGHRLLAWLAGILRLDAHL